MYLEIYQYDPDNHEQVELIQQEVRDFTNFHPQFSIIKTESLVLKGIITIQIWYKDNECRK